MRFLPRWLGRTSDRPPRGELIRFGSDYLTYDSLFSGIALIGATGSGKTSFLEILLRALAEHPSRPGILIGCCKSDAGDSAAKVARKAKRKHDFIRFTPTSGHTVDLFGYLSGRLGQSSQGIARFLDRMSGLSVQNMGQSDDKMWAVQSGLLIANAFDLFHVAGERPTPQSLFDVLVSVPKDVAAAASERFLIDTACGQLLARCHKRHQAKELTPEIIKTFERATGFVLGYLPSLGDRFLGSIIGTSITGLGQFLQEPFNAVFGGNATNLPPECLLDGRIVALDFPAVHGPSAFVAQAAYVQLVQMMLLASPRGNRRPVVIVRDEAQWLVNPEYDAKVQTIARSHGIISVTAVQGYPTMIQAFGGGDAARIQAETFLGSHATHAIFNTAADTETRDHYVKLFGMSRQAMFSGQQQPNASPDFLDRMLGVDFTPTVGWSENMLPLVPPEVFSSLKRGGRENRFIIESILFQAGRRFANGHPFTRIAFQQDVTP